MTRVVIYTRVSTKGQAEDELPIAGQESECKAYAKEMGWEVVKVYQDAGYSGGTIDRPAFQEMYYTAKDTNPKPFDIILTWRSNRLFRDVEARLAYSRLFRRMGIRLVSLHEPEYGENATGRLAETIFGAIDEYYRAQVSEDTLRGLKQVAKQGYSTGGIPPTGYRNIRKPTGRIKANGEPEMRTSWEPDLILAPKIRQAFEMCVAGMTSVEIVEATKVVAAKNGLSTLLRNRAALGERIYNTTRRSSLSEKKTRRIRNSPDHYVVVKDSHPAIVSQELFNQVQNILDSKRPRMGQRKRSPRDYILSGLLICKEHGAPYTGHSNGSNDYYSCAERNKLGGKLAPCPNLKKDAIEHFIVDNLKSTIFTRVLIRKGLECLQEEQARNKREDDIEVNGIRQKIVHIDLELSRIKQAVLEGVKSEAFADDINLRLDMKNKLVKRLAEIDAEKAKSLRLPPMTEMMVDEVINNVHSILDTTEPQELKVALSHFIEKIEMNGKETTIFYSVIPPVKEKVLNFGDPGGI